MKSIEIAKYPEKEKETTTEKELEVTPEREKLLNESLDNIRNNRFFQKFSLKWNELPEEDKKDVYNDGNSIFSITGGIKKKIMSPINGPLRNPLFRLIEKKSFKDQIEKDLFEMISGGIRVFVHLGLLDKPFSVSNDDLIENLKKDSKGLKRQIWVLEKACMLIPELKPLLPFIKTIKPIIESSSEMMEKIMLNEILNKEKKDLKKKTSADLINNMHEINLN